MMKEECSVYKEVREVMYCKSYAQNLKRKEFLICKTSTVESLINIYRSTWLYSEIHAIITCFKF